jgi:hypothetical protein
MNERIKLLAEQAQIRLFEDKSFGWSVIAGTDQHLEKFAELIVKECADVAWRNTPETEELEYSHLISDKIKQHFGVEE